MPDLNLIDDNEMQDSSASQEEHAAPKKKSGGISFKTHITVLLILSVVLGGGYFLWKKGLLPFGKKQTPPVAQVQEEFTADQYQQEAMPTPQEQALSDSADVALLETPLPEEGVNAAGQPAAAQAQAPEEKPAPAEKADEPKPAAAKKEKPAEPAEAETTAPGMAKLSDMKGEYTVKVVTYREKATAVAMAKHLSVNSGYPAFIQKAMMKGGDWWSVCIGRYPTKKEAANAVPAFGEQLRQTSVVVRIVE